MACVASDCSDFWVCLAHWGQRAGSASGVDGSSIPRRFLLPPTARSCQCAWCGSVGFVVVGCALSAAAKRSAVLWGGDHHRLWTTMDNAMVFPSRSCTHAGASGRGEGLGFVVVAIAPMDGINLRGVMCCIYRCCALNSMAFRFGNTHLGDCSTADVATGVRGHGVGDGIGSAQPHR